MQPPRGRILSAFSAWVDRRGPLLGKGGNILADRRDLVSLKQIDQGDRLSRMLRDHFSYFAKVLNSESFSPFLSGIR